MGNTETQECDDQQTGGEKENAEEEGVRELESRLLRKLVELMVRLETKARQMLLDSMESGLVRTLLLADRNGEL
jgi:potassium channel subfamily K